MFALRANRFASLDREGPLTLAKSFSLLFAGLRILVQVMLVAWATLAITIRTYLGPGCAQSLRFFSLDDAGWAQPQCFDLRRSCVVDLYSSLA